MVIHCKLETTERMLPMPTSIVRPRIPYIPDEPDHLQAVTQLIA